MDELIDNSSETRPWVGEGERWTGGQGEGDVSISNPSPTRRLGDRGRGPDCDVSLTNTRHWVGEGERWTGRGGGAFDGQGEGDVASNPSPTRRGRGPEGE